MNIFTELRRLNLPLGEYLVVGSGILGALGIREVADIDLLVSPALFETLRAQGWCYAEVEIEGRIRQKAYPSKHVEAYKDFWYGGKTIDPEELIVSAVIIEGFPFLPLKKFLDIKRALGRDKDRADALLIEKYLLDHSA